MSHKVIVTVICVILTGWPPHVLQGQCDSDMCDTDRVATSCLARSV